jgi:hypothetical protein
MLDSLENEQDLAFLAQIFTRLPADGRRKLKDFLESLVFLQKSVSREDNQPKPPEGNRGVGEDSIKSSDRSM